MKAKAPFQMFQKPSRCSMSFGAFDSAKQFLCARKMLHQHYQSKTNHASNWRPSVARLKQLKTWKTHEDAWELVEDIKCDAGQVSDSSNSCHEIRDCWPAHLQQSLAGFPTKVATAQRTLNSPALSRFVQRVRPRCMRVCGTKKRIDWT